MSVADATDVAGTNQYPVHRVGGENSSYLVRSRHTASLGHGRMQYGQITYQGEGQNIFGPGLRQTNFYISANNAQLIHQLGIQGTLSFKRPDAANQVYAYFPSPTPWWIRQYEIFYGSSLLSSYLREYNVLTTMQVLSPSDYKCLAGVCFFEGGINRDRSATLSTTDIGATAHCYPPIPNKLAGPAYTPKTITAGDSTMAAGYSLTDALYGQSGVLGGSVLDPVEYGGGVPGSALWPLDAVRAYTNRTFAGTANAFAQSQGSIKSPSAPNQDDTDRETRCAIPMRLLDHAVLAPHYYNDNTQASEQNIERDFYIPLHNWLSVGAIWMPHLNQPMRIKVYWASDVNAIAIDEGGGRVIGADAAIGDSYGPAAVNLTDQFGNYAVSQIQGLESKGAEFNSYTSTLPACKAFNNNSVMQVIPRRMDSDNGNFVTLSNLNLYIRGYQYNADIAASIQAMHLTNNVVSRVVVPRVAEYRPDSWQKGLEYTWTQQGFTGVFCEINTLVCHELASDRQYNAVGRSYQTACSISKVQSAEFQDPSGISYGVSQIPGVLIQDTYPKYTYQNSMFPYLFRSICFPFSPDPVGAILLGERKGSQYLNGNWRMKLTPASTRPENAGRFSIPGKANSALAANNAQLDVIGAKRAQYLTTDQTKLSTVVRQVGNQFATITEHPSGSLSVRYL